MSNQNNDSFMDDEFLQDFIVETREHLEAIEMDVLNLETEPGSEKIIHSLFRAFHTIKGLAGFVDQNKIQEIAHSTETIMDLCRKGSISVTKDIENIILSSADLIKEICLDVSQLKNIDFIDKVDTYLEHLNKQKNLLQDTNENTLAEHSNVVRKIGEILLEDGRITKDDLEYILSMQKEHPEMKFGEIAIKEKKAKASDIIAGLRKQKSTESDSVTNGGVIRIPTKKVDNLVDMMGELLITQSQLEQEAVSKFDQNHEFFNKLLNMSRIMKEMQNVSMSLRMVSLKSTFLKIARIARDTIDDMEKNVEFTYQGEETEIDRNIAEKLLEPLVHLVKNSISHGVESSKTRKERGKKLTGKVSVSAYSKKGTVYIVVSDDGNGIDLDKVYEKAVEKKIIEDSDKYKDREILNFIFLPGFSTNKNVDTISGRGVGMDVVKTEISKIGGKIEVDNNPGQGCKFVLKIPINLAVMNGTIISISGKKYIIPTLNIKQIIQSSEDLWINVKGKRSMVKVRESVIPIIELSDLIGDGFQKDKRIIIVFEVDKQLQALPVDDVIDRREIVVKPMAKEFSNLDYISGASILGDGTVSLILDIETLFKINEQKKGVK